MHTEFRTNLDNGRKIWESVKGLCVHYVTASTHNNIKIKTINPEMKIQIQESENQTLQ